MPYFSKLKQLCVLVNWFSKKAGALGGCSIRKKKSEFKSSLESHFHITNS